MGLTLRRAAVAAGLCVALLSLLHQPVTSEPAVEVRGGDLLFSVDAGQDIKMAVGDAEPTSLAALTVRDRLVVGGGHGCAGSTHGCVCGDGSCVRA